MLANMLKLNRDKTELLVIGPKHKVNPPIKGIHVAGEYIEVSNNARIDSHVNLEKHVMNTCKTAFYHLRNIECFHSRGQHICKFIGRKERVCIRKEFNSQRTGLGHQHGRRFIVLGHQYGRREVM